jgi:hypothetical protein
MGQDMTDAALENALARRGATASDLANVVNKINELLDVHNRLKTELEEIDAFIHMWHVMAGIQPPAELEHKKTEAPAEGGKRIRPKNPAREDVARRCVNYIRHEGRPLSRRELFDMLAADGIEIRGKDPEMVLSTMLWRSKDIIRRLPEGGYWPPDEPSPQERETADLLSAVRPDL